MVSAWVSVPKHWQQVSPYVTRKLVSERPPLYSSNWVVSESVDTLERSPEPRGACHRPEIPVVRGADNLFSQVGGSACIMQVREPEVLLEGQNSRERPRWG